MSLKYLALLLIFANSCDACFKLFNLTRSKAEADKKLQGIWNDERANRTTVPCQCGTKNASDPTWILFITFKPDIKLITRGMTGCVGTIVTSNLIATSHNCLHRKSLRQINVFDAWNINEGTVMSKSRVPCNTHVKNGARATCEEMAPLRKKDRFYVPPFLTKDELIVSSKPLGEGERFKVKEIIFQGRHTFDQLWKYAEETKNWKLKASGKKLVDVRNIENDILLIKLDADFTSNPNFNPICVPATHELNLLNQVGEYYGAGMGIKSSPKSVDINPGIVLWKSACERRETKISENKSEQLFPLCMIWEGSAGTINQTLGGGPLVIDSESDPHASFLGGILMSLAQKQNFITATFANILPTIKYLEYQAHKHGSKWCENHPIFGLGPKIEPTEEETPRLWVPDDICGKRGQAGRIKKAGRRGRTIAEVTEGPDVKVEFFTKDDKIIGSYFAEKTCDCTPLPNHRGIPGKVKNNGVCLHLYEDSTCSTSFINVHEISGEESLTAEDVAKTKAFRLCKPFKPCYNVSVILYKISTDAEAFKAKWNLSSTIKEKIVIPGPYYANREKFSITGAWEENPPYYKAPQLIEIDIIKGIDGIPTSGIEMDHEDSFIIKEGDVHGNVFPRYLYNVRSEFLLSSMVSTYGGNVKSKSGTMKFDAEVNADKQGLWGKTSYPVGPCQTLNWTIYISYVKQFSLEYEAHVKIFGRSGCSPPAPAHLLVDFVPPGFTGIGGEGNEYFAVAKGKFVASFNDGAPTFLPGPVFGKLKDCCNEKNFKLDDETGEFTKPC